MITKLLLLVASVSLANIITQEYACKWLRNFFSHWKVTSVMFRCITCMAFWTGLGVFLIGGYGWHSLVWALISSITAKTFYIWTTK